MDENEYEHIRVIGDREIIVDDDITSVLCTELCVALREAEANMLSVSTKWGYDKSPPIILRLRTWGGDLNSALSVVDLIEAMNVDVIVEVNGYCASAGTLISSVAKAVVINPRGFMLVHQLSTVLGGTKAEITDHHNQVKMLHDVIIDIYCNKTNLPKKKIKKMLSRETWLSAKMAVENGFADEIGVI